jgi:hypothetical protein
MGIQYLEIWTDPLLFTKTGTGRYLFFFTALLYVRLSVFCVGPNVHTLLYSRWALASRYILLYERLKFMRRPIISS